MRRLSVSPLAGRGLVCATLLAAPAWADTIVSPRPEAVSVTIYRAPGRGGGGTLDLDGLGGFALVSERRTVTLPAGENVIRFEGVAGGIVPVSAIVTGLPGGVVEKNRDARLLSPAALVAGAYGRRLTLRRTDPATGRVSVEPATLLGGPEGGVVIRTRAGVEALRCAGLPETLLHDGVPAELAPTPTLAVTTRSPVPATVTVTLSYLAEGFDWSANYVARMRPGGAALDLFAWATLANANGEGFPDADAHLVAGTLSRVDARDVATDAPDPELRLDCWPVGTTHGSDAGLPPSPPMVMMMAAAPMSLAVARDVVVTAKRLAQREELGDLKLYRLPERVTVGPRAQKQVALLAQANVPVERIYRFAIDGSDPDDAPATATIVLRTRNLAANRLGLPLPAGGVAVLERGPDRELLAGEAALRDVAVGEEVELALGESAQVRATTKTGADGARTIVLTNADPFAVTAEVTLELDDGDTAESATAPLARKDGRPLWRVRVPANGSATLRYTLRGA